MTIEAFRAAVRACSTWEELFVFLTTFNHTYGYGLTAQDRDIPFEDIQFTDKGLFCAYYQQGGRTYKTIESFAKNVVFWNRYRIKEHQHHFHLVYERTKDTPKTNATNRGRKGE